MIEQARNSEERIHSIDHSASVELSSQVSNMTHDLYDFSRAEHPTLNRRPGTRVESNQDEHPAIVFSSIFNSMPEHGNEQPLGNMNAFNPKGFRGTVYDADTGKYVYIYCNDSGTCYKD